MSERCIHVWGIDGMHGNQYCKKCFCDYHVQRYEDNGQVMSTSEDGRWVTYTQYKTLRDERDRLRHALEQVSFHLAQPGDDETPANQYVPTAAETLTCQRIIEAALTPAGGGQE